jgi:hypothetical protein
VSSLGKTKSDAHNGNRNTLTSSSGSAIDPSEMRSAPLSCCSDLAQFTLKALVVIRLIVGAFILSAAWRAPKFERVVRNTEAKMQQYTKVGGAQFWEKLVRELGRAADPAYEIPPEKKRKLLSQIHGRTPRRLRDHGPGAPSGAV